MAISVRESREFHGDGLISLVALSKLEQRPFPVSIRDLATVDKREVPGELAAGDVTCDFLVTLYNSGNWYVSATLHDKGIIAGDSFGLEFILDEGRGVGIHLQGELKAKETRTITKNGNDPWIRENWSRIKDSRIRGRAGCQAELRCDSLVDFYCNCHRHWCSKAAWWWRSSTL